MSYNLYLDDERIPKTNRDWVIVRSFEEFKKTIEEKGVPKEISFDHDLGADSSGDILPSGYDCFHWLLYSNYDITDTVINYHTSNPAGKLNMESLENTWRKVQKL